MKIAVIGGNLLGCATTLDLALVQAHDERRATDAVTANPSADPIDPFQVTVFDKNSRLGGNSFKAVRIDEDLSVEVGAYRSIPLQAGSYLRDLVDAANGALGAVVMFGRPFHLPGSQNRARGTPGAAPTFSQWTSGSYHRILRSFAAWDWKADSYHQRYVGWTGLDLLHRLLDNAIWRSLSFTALLWAVRQLDAAKGHMNRAIALIQVAIFFTITLFSPKRIVALWQSQYSFWACTLPLLMQYGITPAISRGSTEGFAKHIATMNEKNAATVSVSINSLLTRTGLEAYVRGTGEDYVRKFKYNANFVQRYMAPFVATAYCGARMNEVSSLAAHFAMFDADYTNSDVETRLQCVRPDNATLCEKLVDAARATTDVEVKLESKVLKIELDQNKQQYVVTMADESVETFDGIILCATPRDEDLIITTQRKVTLNELLGYERDAEAAARHVEDEGGQEGDPIVPGSACSHVAVVEGVAKGSFFRFATERQIPDVVQLSYARSVSQFERMREVGDDGENGVYRVLCGPDFVSSGVLAEMFENGAEVRYHEAIVAQRAYSQTALPRSMDVDDCTPFIVLGKRLVYAAATECLAKHPEMDAISAMNAASLLSRAVAWGDLDASEEVDGDETEDAKR